MNIIIKANHGLELTNAIKDYVEKKISLAVKNFRGIDKVSVLLEKDNSSHHNGEMYKVSVNISGDKDIFLEDIQEDLYVAIDIAKDKLEHKLSSRKDKAKTVLKRFAYKFKNILKSEK